MTQDNICPNTSMRHVIEQLARSASSAYNCDEIGIYDDLCSLIHHAEDVAIGMGYDEMDVQSWANRYIALRPDSEPPFVTACRQALS